MACKKKGGKKKKITERKCSFFIGGNYDYFQR